MELADNELCEIRYVEHQFLIHKKIERVYKTHVRDSDRILLKNLKQYNFRVVPTRIIYWIIH